jgi:hypothetical protein
VADGDHALFTLWTKYGKWESERPLMFEERAVQRQSEHLRASAGVDVPTSCTVLNLGRLRYFDPGRLSQIAV